MNTCKWGFMSLAILLAACGSSKVFETASAPGGDTALVYFIRDSYPPYIYAVRLLVNGKQLATIANNDYVAVNVPVGNNSFTIDLNWNLRVFPVTRTDAEAIVSKFGRRLD